MSTHPLYYLPRPTGLRLDFSSGAIRHIASQYLESHLKGDGTVCDLFFGSCVVRVTGSNLIEVVRGLENEEHPLGRLAAISEGEPGEALAIVSKVKVIRIEYLGKLESDFAAFEDADPESEDEKGTDPLSPNAEK